MWCSKVLCVTIIALGLTSISCDDSNNAKIVYISSTSQIDGYSLSEAPNLLKNPNFNAKRKSVLYIHGFNETYLESPTQTIINAYIQEGSYNLLVLDWSTLAGGSYLKAVGNASELGPKIAEILLNLFSMGLHSDIHIVGHSLGAHLGGQIGRTISTKSNGAIKLQRISGLDPAFPGYYPPILGTQHINRNDATFVDIIHTNAGTAGSPKATGTVDFWVDGGRKQPGCGPLSLIQTLIAEDTCSHRRSVLLWAESVSSTSSSTFRATLIRNPSITSQMGLHTSMDSVHGSYAIQTNSMPPYSRS